MNLLTYKKTSTNVWLLGGGGEKHKLGDWD